MNVPHPSLADHGRVKAVTNDIEVRLPASAERTDADIAAAVTRALAPGVSSVENRITVKP